jgi:hypothetical protein
MTGKNDAIICISTSSIDFRIVLYVYSCLDLGQPFLSQVSFFEKVKSRWI